MKEIRMVDLKGQYEKIKEEVDGWRLIDLVKEPVSNPEDSDNK